MFELAFFLPAGQSHRVGLGERHTQLGELCSRVIAQAGKRILAYDPAVVLRGNVALLAAFKDVAEHPRSEEHTSELQSQSNLVCRLLLEKKKKKNTAYQSLRTGRSHESKSL